MEELDEIQRQVVNYWRNVEDNILYHVKYEPKYPVVGDTYIFVVNSLIPNEPIKEVGVFQLKSIIKKDTLILLNQNGEEFIYKFSSRQ